MFPFLPRPFQPKRATVEPPSPPVVMPPVVAPPAAPDRRERAEQALDQIQAIASRQRPRSEPNRVEYSSPCVGLCAGDGCADCQNLADQITAAKNRPPGIYREARLSLLAERVADQMGVRS